MSYKPTNPYSKHLDDAIQYAIPRTHHQMENQLRIIHTKIDNHS